MNYSILLFAPYIQVKIQVFKTFPNDGPITADVSPDTKDLTFAVNQFGPKIFELTILPFIGSDLFHLFCDLTFRRNKMVFFLSDILFCFVFCRYRLSRS